jgi:hypothetical protein
VSLVVFAFFEIILFAWIFGMNKGWEEITRGADIKVPIFFRYIIQYVTPVILGWVFLSSIPAILSTIRNDDIHTKKAALIVMGKVSQSTDPNWANLVSSINELAPTVVGEIEKTVKIKGIAKNPKALLAPDAMKAMREATAPGNYEKLEKTILYRTFSRLLLLAVWAGIAFMVYIAYRKRVREGRFSL